MDKHKPPRQFRFIAQELGSDEYIEYPFAISHEFMEQAIPAVFRAQIHRFASDLADNFIEKITPAENEIT